MLRSLSMGDPRWWSGRPARAFVIAAMCLQSLLADDLLSSGIRLAQQERYAEAAEVFRRCVLAAPKSFEAHYDLALALLALGQFAESRQTIEQVRPQNAAETGTREYILGKIDVASGDKTRARAELSLAFHASPGEENLAVDYGLFLIGEGDYQSALATFSRALDIHPESMYLQFGRAMAQAFGGEREAAVVTCRHITKSNPDFAPAVLLRAFAEYMSGDYRDAERSAAAGMQLPSAPPYLHYIRAAALQKMNSTSYGEMLADLEAAEKNIPSCTLCYFVRSKIHESAGDIPGAIADLNMLVTRFAPDFDQAWYRLALLYRKQGQTIEADAALDRFKASRAISANPEIELARDSLLQQQEQR